MSQAAMDNLVRIGQLKAEPRNTSEAKRMNACNTVIHGLHYPHA